VLTGQAVQVAGGTFHPRALAFLALAIACCAASFMAPRARSVDRTSSRLLLAVFGLGIGLQLWQHVLSAPGKYVPWAMPYWKTPFLSGLGASAVLSVLLLLRVPGARRVWFPALLATHAALGAWVIRGSPWPYIDVFLYHREAAWALLHGDNPYALRFVDIYTPRFPSFPYYTPEMTDGSYTTFGFIYPPLSLLLALPGHLLGDFRFSQLGAVTAAATLMALAGPRGWGLPAAVLFLLTPRVFYVVEMGWTEPFVVLLLAAVVLAAKRFPRALAPSLGLLLAVKQYLVLVALLAPLLTKGRARPALGLLARAALVACLPTLPFILWDPRALFHDLVTVQLQNPFRPDALSFAAWLARQAGGSPSAAWAPLAAAAAAAFALWRAPRDAAGFAASVALVFFAFFAFNKQAFCNYYFFMVGALCSAVAATGDTDPVAPGHS
jgi:uncharacterized membrane protein